MGGIQIAEIAPCGRGAAQMASSAGDFTALEVTTPLARILSLELRHSAIAMETRRADTGNTESVAKR